MLCPTTDLSLLPPTSQVRAFPLPSPVLYHFSPDICMMPTLPSRRCLNIIQSVTLISQIKRKSPTPPPSTSYLSPCFLFLGSTYHLTYYIFASLFTVSPVRLHKGRDFISSKTQCLKISALLMKQFSNCQIKFFSHFPIQLRITSLHLQILSGKNITE